MNPLQALLQQLMANLMPYRQPVDPFEDAFLHAGPRGATLHGKPMTPEQLHKILGIPMPKVNQPVIRPGESFGYNEPFGQVTPSETIDSIMSQRLAQILMMLNDRGGVNKGI